MTFSNDDKAYIRKLVGDIINSRNQAAGKKDKEILLHLYDALWENMRSKENRLWTFLSIYGAAVGLVFAGGQISQIPGADLFAIVIVMALSTWAVLIIINANWWYCRNQLMVSCIEVEFSNTVKGIVPKIYYENPNYRYDPLSKSSILLLSVLLLLLYSRTMWSYHYTGSISDWQSLVAVILLYVLFVLSVDYCLRRHEFDVANYYRAKKDLLKDAAASNSLSVDERLKLLKVETDIRKSFHVRIGVLLLLGLVSWIFDFIIYGNGISLRWLIAVIVVQVFAIVIFGIREWIYTHPYGKEQFEAAKNDQQLDALEKELDLKDKRLYKQWPMLLVMLICAGLAGYPLYNSNQQIQEDLSGAKTPSATDIGDQLSKIQQELEGLQKSYNELQQNNIQLQNKLLDEKLKPYTTRDEAEQRFMTKEAFNDFLKSQPKRNP